MVGFEAFDADLFESGEELADAAVVLDPALGVVGLVLGEVFADGFVGDLAGPVPVGAVQARGVVVAGGAVGFHPLPPVYLPEDSGGLSCGDQHVWSSSEPG